MEIECGMQEFPELIMDVLRDLKAETLVKKNFFHV